MDKNNYETYEYLPTDTETDGSQFFVVQEDGTYLCIDRPIQYVTQVQDVKEALDGVQPYVTSQQLYIDRNNPTQLITESDQFIMPDGENSIYGNNFLVPAVQNNKEKQMDQDDSGEFKEEVEGSAGDDEDADKDSGDCTEITLSDEQYQILEQKGWILLESGDKTFLLDTTGLHDITTDENLIRKLKSELQDDCKEEEVSSSVTEENVIKPEEDMMVDDENSLDEHNTEETVQYVIEDERCTGEESQETAHSTNSEESPNPQMSIEQYLDEADQSTEFSEHDYVKMNSVKHTRARRDNDSLKIKTKLLFKDIPSEIVLGKFNGKKLVASVVKTVKPIAKSSRKFGNNLKDAGLSAEQLQACKSTLEDGKFEELIREAVRGAELCGVKDVAAADTVVGQLLRVPAFHSALVERRLLVTKVLVQENEFGVTVSESAPTLVTGQAREGERGGWHFEHLPDLIQRLALFEEENEDAEDALDGSDFDFLHIHIQETKSADGITKISIILNKRHIPLQLYSDIKLRHPKTIFACSACAAVYKTQEGLQLHQETECLEADNALTIDVDDTSNAYTTIDTSSGKLNVCNLCNIVFAKATDFQKHIKIHISNRENKNNKKSPSHQENKAKKSTKIYMCKMCNRAYLHAATLSKHIVSSHIKRI